eukprot:scaffold82192_cov63-Phaeocystis_antarctica.AAC.5
MLPLRRASSNVALHAARSVSRDIHHAMRRADERARAAGNARAHGDVTPCEKINKALVSCEY